MRYKIILFYRGIFEEWIKEGLDESSGRNVPKFLIPWYCRDTNDFEKIFLGISPPRDRRLDIKSGWCKGFPEFQKSEISQIRHITMIMVQVLLVERYVLASSLSCIFGHELQQELDLSYYHSIALVTQSVV